MTRKGWRGRLTDDERAVLLWGAMLDGDEDVFPTKEALAAAWFANRADLLAAWAAGAEKDVPRSTMPYGYWAAESPTGDPYHRAELRAIARALKRHRAVVAARQLHKKETPK
jgi:hypothetical protein